MYSINELIYERKVRLNAQANEYSEILCRVREHLTEHYKNEFGGDLTTDSVKDRYKILIQKVIREKGLYLREYTEQQLTESLYNSMVKYDFLTPYIEGDSGSFPDDPLYHSWEEINCNWYDDIEVVVGGEYYKLEKGFDSPKSCEDMVKRLVRLGNITLDQSKPRGDSYLGNGIRITATIPPLVDPEAGATFSIRRQKPITNDKDFFIRNGTATEEQIEFILMMLNYGISVGFSGRTRSGKTTDINFFLRNVSHKLRKYSIEDTRELNGRIKDEHGKTISRVVHTITRKSDDESLVVTAEDLVNDALRYDPDLIALGEMRGREAKTTITAGGTDHPLITGIHAPSIPAGYRRMATLYMDAGTNISEKMVFQNIVEAIPIMVHKKVFPTGERRYMSICEASLSKDLYNPEIVINEIFRFHLEDFERDPEGNPIHVLGKHEKVGCISDALAQRLFENGAPMKLISRYADPKFLSGKGGVL